LPCGVTPGIEVEILPLAAAGELQTRITTEKASPKADIFIGGSSEFHDPLGKQGLLEAYKSPNAADVDATLKNADGMWTGWYIGIFGLCSMTSILAFTPGRVWDRIGQRIRTPERRGVAIYYDEPCGFCRKICLILRMFLLLPETPILPAQQVPAIHREMQMHNSWVVVDHDGSHHVRFDAIVRVFRRSVLFSWLGRLFALAPMRAIGERIYAWVARNRGELGRWSAVTLPYRSRPITPSAGAQVVAGLLLAVLLIVNLQSIHVVVPGVVGIADPVAETLHLAQGWTMFAPQPSRLDGWFVARGTIDRVAAGVPTGRAIIARPVRIELDLHAVA